MSTLNLEVLYSLVKEREAHNLQIIDSVADKRVFYPFGYTGAGKTTFILWSNGVPLVSQDGKYRADGELPPELAHLQIGQTANSCTVYVSATVCKDFTFLDGPGFEDAKGVEVDISNVVSMGQILKQVTRFTPVLFIDYLLFDVVRGSKISKLVQGFCAMFSNNTDNLEKYMVVVWTKVPKGVTLDTIQKRVRELIDADAVGNTKEVMDILYAIADGIENTKLRRTTKLMCNRVLIFNPEDEHRSVRSLFKSIDQMENPSEFYVVDLSGEAKSALDNALNQLRADVPILLQNTETEKLVTRLLLLKKLSDMIPSVKNTLHTCAEGLHKSLFSQILEAKEHLEGQLLDGIPINLRIISKFTEARAQLGRIEELRQFMGPLETTEVFDNWTLQKIDQLAKATLQHEGFAVISMNLAKIRALEEPLSYLTELKHVVMCLISWVEQKVRDLQRSIVVDIQLCPEEIDLVTNRLRALKAAAEQVQKLISLDCTELLQSAVSAVNAELESIYQRLDNLLQNPPTSMDKKFVNDFQTLKAAAHNKELIQLLAQNASANEVEGLHAGTLYKRIFQLSIESTKRLVEQLTHVAKSSAALDASSERFICSVKTIGELDNLVMHHTELELTKAMLCFTSAVDGVMENLKKVLYRQEGPSYCEIPLLFRQLDSCVWLDKYSYSGRIAQKKEEAIEHLNGSLKSLTTKIRIAYKKGNYTVTQNLYTTLEDELSILESSLPSYAELTSTTLEYLQADLEKIFSQYNQRVAADELSLPDGDSYIGLLVKLAGLSNSVGLDTRHNAVLREVKKHLSDKCNKMMNSIALSGEYKFGEYREILDCLAGVRSKELYPNLDESMRVFDKARSLCITKVNQVKGQLATEDAVESREWLSILENAGALSYYLLPDLDVYQIIKEEKARITKVQQDKTKQIESLCRGFAFSDARELFESLTDAQRGGALRFLIEFFSNMLLQLRNAIAFYRAFSSSTSSENQQAFLALRSDITRLEEGSRAFGSVLVGQHSFDFTGTLSQMYALLDQNLCMELRFTVKRASEIGFLKVDERIKDMKMLIPIFDCLGGKLPKTEQAVTELLTEADKRMETAYTQLEKLEQNIETIDAMCVNLFQCKDPEAERYLSKVIGRIKMLAEKPTPTLAEVNSKLSMLDNLKQHVFFDRLREAVDQAHSAIQKSVDDKRKVKDAEFRRCLDGWDVAGMSRFFNDAAKEADDISTQQRMIREALPKLIAKTEDVMQRTDMDTLRSNIEIICAVRSEFPTCVDDKCVKSLVTNIQHFAREQVTNLKDKFACRTLDTARGVLQSISIVFNLKMLGDLLLEAVIIPEDALEMLISEITNLLSANKSNLQASIARKDFSLMAKTFEWLRVCDPWRKSLWSMLQKSTHTNFALLIAILKDSPDMAQSKGMVENFLSTLSDAVEQMWEKQEFTPIEKLIIGVKSESFKQLVHLFPRIEEKLNGAVTIISDKYDLLGKKIENSFRLENWKDFREGLALLESMSQVELALGKDLVQIRIKCLITDRIEAIKTGTASTIADTANSLVELNKISRNIPQFAHVVEHVSAALISAYAGKSRDKIYELGLTLEQTHGLHGKDVVSSFKAFSIVSLQAWTKKTVTQTVEWALDMNENGDPRFVYTDTFESLGQTSAIWFIDKAKAYMKSKTATTERDNWKKWHDQFKKEFREKYDKCILHELEETVEETKELIRKRSFLPSILARICVVWSFQKTGGMSSGQGQTFRLEPHPIQLLCLFRLLQTSNSTKFCNQLVEILTGEGKSVVLGICATYFALCGFAVHSICYSQYLSERDYKDFEQLFDAFGVKDTITYSTISNMCEIIINNKGNVRNLAKNVIENASRDPESTKTTERPAQSVLLIDEVDVFFGKDFYGNTYNPATLISNNETFEILHLIYNHRASVDMNIVSKTKFYADLMKAYPKLQPLFDLEIRKMLQDIKCFEDTPEKPILVSGIIYYKDQDMIACDKFYGYKTFFQYFHKFTQGEIPDLQGVKDHVGIFLGCGNFSFAEIPNSFTYKMGVSGTLRSLVKEEKEIVQSYGIQRLAYCPSIYGVSLLNEKESSKASIITMQQTKDMWFLRITNISKEKQRAGRAVLVFFENIDVLSEFTSTKGAELGDYQILEEKVKFKDTIIKQATQSGTVTLCTRPFGRGVDFICLDAATEASNGVHIIQCFVASSASEQIQIEGRTARQGQPGSHEYVLFHGDLVKYLGTKDGQPEDSGFKNYDIDSKLTQDALFQKIVRLRDELYSTEVRELSTRREDAQKAHIATTKFHEKLISYDGSPQSINDITNSILEINQAALSSAVAKYHLVFCLDESGSMTGQPWKDLMAAVSAFIDKRIELCNANHCPTEDLVTVVNHATTARIVFREQKITSKPQTSIDFRSGGNDFAVAFNTALPVILGTRAGFTPCLIFMSDGGCGNGEAEMEKIRAQCPTLQVFVVGFGSGCARDKLSNLAKIGGGAFFFGADGLQLKTEFEVISTKLSGGVMALK